MVFSLRSHRSLLLDAVIVAQYTANFFVEQAEKQQPQVQG